MWSGRIKEAGYNVSTGKPPIVEKPSPNYTVGIERVIDRIVVHNTAGPLISSLHQLMTPSTKVSAHYVVDRLGTIFQLVKDKDIAWHAGVWAVNKSSIGIEVVAWKGAPGMEPNQEIALKALLRWLMGAYKVKRERILPHRKVVATQCPSFLWATDLGFEEWKKSL